MCSPTAVMLTVTAVSAAFTANQQIQQGKFEQGVAKYNARLAENEAERTRAAATEEENKQRRMVAELISKQRAQLGAAGVELESGSPLQLQTDTAELGEIDALRIRSNFDQQVGALKSEAELTEAEGDFARSRGKSAAFGTLLGATGSVIRSGVADKWLTPKSAAAQSGNKQSGNVVPFEQKAKALGFG